MKKTLYIFVLILFTLSLVYAGDYVGAKKCKMCHKGKKKGEVWESGAIFAWLYNFLSGWIKTN
ncbi:hypothetical protein H8E88_14120 [candidate division KSB1 bacterium]|nr:hypothetical protein [candidate division KSB1 bacterium]MBL7092657.1 hypothetical protein [candidate division KSB1 bacterium]